MRTVPTHRGFTLIELLVVVAIIGILSSVALSALTLARAKGRDAVRLQNLREIRTALETYRTTYGTYPLSKTLIDVEWRSQCTGLTTEVGDASGSDGWIPNLAPAFMQVLPSDPKPGGGTTGQCYMYMSDGRNFMVVAYGTVETFTAGRNPAPWPAFPTEPSFAFYTDGAKNWPN